MARKRARERSAAGITTEIDLEGAESAVETLSLPTQSALVRYTQVGDAVAISGDSRARRKPPENERVDAGTEPRAECHAHSFARSDLFICWRLSIGAGKSSEIVKNSDTSVEPGDDRRFIPAPAERPPHKDASANGRSRLRLAAVFVLALIVGLVTWFVTAKSDKPSKSNKATTTVVSEQGLQELVGTINEPVFWLGPEQGMRYAVEQRSNGQVYVRYLTERMKADTVATLTVGTYPMKNAYARTVALGKKSGWKRLATGIDGPVAFTRNTLPRNVYVVQSGLDYQIEIYDPAPGRAAAIVQAGRALPVTQGERLGLTRAALKKKVASLGTPVYWIGPKSGVTYEYTRSPSGSVYLRYLPSGVAVGASAAYPTVGTYPMKNATATTRAAANRAGSIPVKLAGAEAFYSESKPTSVYVAFAGSDYQIEVYDRVAAQALAAVKSGQVRPID